MRKWQQESLRGGRTKCNGREVDYLRRRRNSGCVQRKDLRAFGAPTQTDRHREVHGIVVMIRSWLTTVGVRGSVIAALVSAVIPVVGEGVPQCVEEAKVEMRRTILVGGILGAGVGEAHPWQEN
jgi:hypothetical protein